MQFGLAKGSADIVGWTTKTITEDDVGKSYAIFTSIEVKTPTGRLTGLQQNWLHTVQTAGGFAGVAKGPQRTPCRSSPPDHRHPLKTCTLSMPALSLDLSQTKLFTSILKKQKATFA